MQTTVAQQWKKFAGMCAIVLGISLAVPSPAQAGSSCSRQNIRYQTVGTFPNHNYLIYRFQSEYFASGIWWLTWKVERYDASYNLIETYTTTNTCSA